MMAAYFERTQKKDKVAFHVGGKLACYLIDFDFDSLPPQVFVAIETAYRMGHEDGMTQKSDEIRALIGAK